MRVYSSRLGRCGKSARQLLVDIEQASRARHMTLIQLCNRTREWLRELDDSLVLEDVEPLEAELTGDDLTKEIVTTRVSIAELKAERTRVSFRRTSPSIAPGWHWPWRSL